MIKTDFKTGEKNKHVTLKVILGYFFFAIVAFGSIFYILTVIKEMTIDDGSEQDEREKAFLITRAITLLNESAAIGLPIGMTEEHFNLFNQKMDETHQYLEQLRSMLTDSAHILGIDTIEIFLEDKRLNTLQLYTIWKDMNTERLYTKDVKKLVSDTLVTQVEIKEQAQTKKDSVLLLPRTKKSFFRRLADAFVSPKDDVEIVVNTKRNVQIDTLVNVYNPVDTISSVLKERQKQMAKERKQLVYQLYDKAAELRHNNVLINTRINQILYAIEEEEMSSSVERMVGKQKLYSEILRNLGIVVIVAILIILAFTWVISRDIAKSKYYRRQLEKAKQYAEEILVKQEKFMLAVSHDIRAPMSSILGYVELLLRRKPDERQRYYLENMIGSSNHILSLVNDLLDFHRLDSGKMELQNVPFTFKPLMEDIFHSFKPMAEAKELKFRLSVQDDGLETAYLGDTIRIRQIINNLLSNAIKFTQEGSVTLSASIVNTELNVFVKDTGPGIAKEDQIHLFEEFIRSKNEKEEGFGLGLSITRKLVDLMGGTISFESELGEGSLFQMRIPLGKIKNSKENKGNFRDTGTDGLETAGRVIKCLLVDDDALQLILTKELLRQSLVRVDTCTDPHQVICLLKENLYDVVITDIQMPGLDGFELVKQIRSSDLPNAASLPIVALSASVANEKEDYLKAGFTGFLNKPFTAVELVSVFNNLLAVDLQLDVKLDFSSLSDFVGEDDAALASILKTFKEESSQNRMRLKSALQQNDRVKSSRVAHKMIPVFSMIGANHLVQGLRLLEKNDSEMSDDTWRSLLASLDLQVTEILEEVETRIGECGVE
ncbi:MAG: ATP-binding protein [Massilibacteroides sp.]|nr:ATP-binding protein [Massilibacteroides sp.]MDD3063400.1 ATP-binding protein [Massilibacteroides sp.]MDD4661145.1 ATP-binding protein [Massilibacteroides sp.]